MRHALGIVAALALAACQVDVGGAVCREPGATTDCPSGQACGNDGRCSARALACASTRCTPGEARCIDAAEVEQCSGADSACGKWERVSCADRQLVCGRRPERQAACECPPSDGAEIAAGAGGSLEVREPPYPSGLAAPAECRFGRLGDALAAAAARIGDGATAATVRVHADTGTDVVFGAVTGEVFPLAVPAGVTLVGPPGPAGEGVVRAGEAVSVLTVSGALEGLRVEGEGATSTGVAVSCGAGATPPSLTDVTIVGGGTIATGIEIAGGDCGASLAGVEVSGAIGPALTIDATGSGAVTVERSRFSGSGRGIVVTGGKVTIGSDEPADAVEVSGNAGGGVVLTGGTAKRLDVELRRLLVAGNGGTGVVLETVALASKVAIAACEIYGNGATTPRSYGLDGSIRRAGGVLVLQNDGLASFLFAGNRVYANGPAVADVDQVAVWSDAAWSLGPLACGPGSNALGCVGIGGRAVSVAGKATVRAEYNVWSSSQPEGLVSGASWDPPCPANANGAPPALVCPSP